MPSSYTTSLRLTLPATGELAGQWGNTVNTGITELLDAAVAGTTTISTWGGAGVSYTLSNNSGSADEARRMFIVATGTPGEAKNVICPAVSKFYVFRNDTTGGFALTLKTPSGTGVSVPAGQYRFLYCDGTNVVEMFNSVGSLTVIGALNAGSVNATTLDLTNLEVTNIKAKDGTASMTLADATGVATFSANPILNAGTANGVLYLNGSKVATSGGALAFNGTTLTADTASTTAANFRIENGTYNRVGSFRLTTDGVQFDSFDQNNAASTRQFMWLSGGAEQMRLTTTGLGIGTSSPAQKLDIRGTNPRIYLAPNTGTEFAFLQVQNTGGSAFIGLENSAGSGLSSSSPYSLNIYQGGAYPIRFSTNGGSNVMLYDSSGNLGIGTSSPGAKLHVVGSQTILQGVSGAYSIWKDGTPTKAGRMVFNTAVPDGLEWGLFDGSSWSSGMVLTPAGNIGIGTTSPSARLTVSGGVSITSDTVITGGSLQYRNGISLFAWNFDTTNFYSVTNVGATGAGNAALAFGNAGGEQMRLTSAGNLGIGTSSPVGKLDVRGATYVDTDYAYFRANNVLQRLRIGTDGVNDIYLPGTAPLTISGQAGIAFSTDFTERMRLDASGNLGLGTTPSAWSGQNAFQIGDAASVPLAYIASDAAGSTVTNIGHGAYWNGSNWLYTASSIGATRYQMTGANAGSTHAWFVSAGGTAGNAISFTQAMTLDASGNLAVGTTTTTAGRFTVAGNNGIIVNGNGAAGYNGVQCVNDNGVTLTLTCGGSTAVGWAQNSATVGTTTNHALLLGTNNTERARITSGGYFKASNNGTYVDSSGPYHELRKTENNLDWTAVITNAAASSANQFGLKVDLTLDPNGTSNEFLYCEGASTLRASIRSNGGLANYSGNDVNLSDRREKTNFAPAKSYLDTICAIPVQTFEYIDQSPDDPGLTLGVVAQDVQAVAPELVMESNWGTEDNPKMRLSIYQTDLQYALMKCIQELKAELDAVKTELATLKGN